MKTKAIERRMRKILESEKVECQFSIVVDNKIIETKRYSIPRAKARRLPAKFTLNIGEMNEPGMA